MDKSACSSPIAQYKYRWQSTGGSYACMMLATFFTLTKGATIVVYNIFANCALTEFWCAGVTANGEYLVEQKLHYPSAAAAVAALPNIVP